MGFPGGEVVPKIGVSSKVNGVSCDRILQDDVQSKRSRTRILSGTALGSTIASAYRNVR